MVLQIKKNMGDRIIKLISDKSNLIKPKKYKNNIFTIFAQNRSSIKIAETENIDTELIIDLPENFTAFFTTKFEGQDIQKLVEPCRKRLWINILSESYLKEYQIKKEDLIGYLVIEPDNPGKINVHYIAKEKSSGQKRKMANLPDNYLAENWEKEYKNFFFKKKK